MPSRKSPLTTLQSLYTAASRHHLSMTLVTDNAKRLITSLEKNLKIEKMEANILWPEKEAQMAKEPERQEINQFIDRIKSQQKHEIEQVPEKKIERSFGIGMWRNYSRFSWLGR